MWPVVGRVPHPLQVTFPVWGSALRGVQRAATRHRRRRARRVAGRQRHFTCGPRHLDFIGFLRVRRYHPSSDVFQPFKDRKTNLKPCVTQRGREGSSLTAALESRPLTRRGERTREPAGRVPGPAVPQRGPFSPGLGVPHCSARKTV